MVVPKNSLLQPFLDRLLLRSHLTSDECRAFLALSTREIYVEKGADFVGYGDSVTHTCLIAHGLAARFDRCKEGTRQITGLYVPGDMPDLFSVVQPKMLSALNALSDVTLTTIFHSTIRAAVSEYPGLGEALWRDCIVDASILAQWVINGRLDAMTRVARLLCEMACRYGVAPAKGQIRYQLIMTQEQMADATGMTSVHLNRRLQALRQVGLNVRSRIVCIQDWNALCDAAAFDPEYLQLGIKPDTKVRIAA